MSTKASGIPGAIFGFVAAAAFAWSSAELFKQSPADAQPSPVDSDIARLGGRFHFRPVLRDAASQGNAADHYRRAAAAMLQGDEMLVDAIESGETPERSDMEVWVHVNREALDRMSKGAASSGSTLNVDHGFGFDARCAEAGRSIDVAVAAAAEALLLRGAGKVTQARRLLMDAAAFGKDLARGGGLVHRAWGCRIVFLALRWLAEMLAFDRLRGWDLRELYRETEALEASAHPAVETALSEAAFALGEARSLAPPERDAEIAGILAFEAAARSAAESGALDLDGLGVIAASIPGSAVLKRTAEFAPVAARAERLSSSLLAAIRALIEVRMAALAFGNAPATLESARAALGLPAAQTPGLRLVDRGRVLRFDNGAGPDSPAVKCAFWGPEEAWEWKLEAIAK